MYQASNQQQQQQFRRGGTGGTGGGIISQLCPNMLGYYIDANINSIPKLLNHSLYITIVCNIMLFIRCYSHNGTSQLLGYSTLFISFLLLMQSICVYFILNNKSNNNIRLSPNQFMIGMTLGLCMGGTIISFMISKSYRNSSKQCNSLHHYTMTMAGGSHNNNNSTNSNNGTNNINNQIIGEEEWELLLRHDPIIQYLCSISIQKIMKRRTFWSSWLFWMNLLNTILIAYGRPELTTDADIIPGQSPAASMYMGVPTNETSNNNNAGPVLPPNMQPPSSSSSYNNPITNHMSSNSSNSSSNNSVFSGNYATIPEVRPGGGPPSSSSTLLKTGDNPATVMNV